MDGGRESNRVRGVLVSGSLGNGKGTDRFAVKESDMKGLL